ncbi:hypothetical protein AB6D11_00915 [Vibrio splendidus]
MSEQVNNDFNIPKPYFVIGKLESHDALNHEQVDACGYMDAAKQFAASLWSRTNSDPDELCYISYVLSERFDHETDIVIDPKSLSEAILMVD